MSFSQINSFNLSLSELFFLFITTLILNLAFQNPKPLGKNAVNHTTYLIQKHPNSIPCVDIVTRQMINIDVGEILNKLQETEPNRMGIKLSLLFRHNRVNRYTPFDSRTNNIVPEMYTNYLNKISLKNIQSFLNSMRC